jgi:hypothetical protein
MARRKGSRKYHKRGGAVGAASSTSYNDSQSFMRATVGSANQQYDNVFKQGNNNSNDSNTIVGLQGQKAGSRRRRRSKKGGFLGSVINQAIVPFGILGLQQTYRRKHSNNGTRKFRRHRRH